MFMVNQLAGFSAGGVIIPPSIVFTDITVDASNSATYTFSNQSIGTAAAGRLVACVTYVVNAGTVPGLATLTIGGNTATLVAQAITTQAVAGLFTLQVDTGTTTTVVVGNGSGGNLRCFLATYAIYDLLSTTAADSATTLTDAGSLACDTVSGSIVLAGCGQNGGSGLTPTWTGVSGANGTAGNHNTPSEAAADFSSGHAIATAAETRTINCNWSGSPTFIRGVAATWR